MTEAKAAKKPNPALVKPFQPSNELAAIVGSTPLPRTEVVARCGTTSSPTICRTLKTSGKSWPMISFGLCLGARARSACSR